MDRLQRPKSCISYRNESVSPGQFRRCLTPTHEIIMTTEGFRSMRIDNQQMNKYRPKSAIEFSHSRKPTNVSQINSESKRLENRPHDIANAEGNRCQKQQSKDRPVSSNRSLIYTTRNAVCKPNLITFPSRDFEMLTKERKGPTFYEKRSTMRQRPTQVPPTVKKLTKYQTASSKRGKVLPQPEQGFTTDLDHRQFLLGIAKIYSPKQTRELKQKRYQEVLDLEFAKRWLTRELKEKQRTQLWKEYQRYHEYIMELNKPPMNRFTRVEPHNKYPKIRHQKRLRNSHLNVSSSNDSQTIHDGKVEDNFQEDQRSHHIENWVNAVNFGGVIQVPEWQRDPVIDSLPSSSSTDNHVIFDTTNQI